MPGTRQSHIGVCNLNRGTAGQYGRIIGQGFLHPFLGIRWVGFYQRQNFLQGIVFFEILPGKFLQCFLGIRQVVSSDNSPGTSIVITGPGLVHVGNSRQTHLETLLRLLELPLQSLFLGLGESYAINQGQHQEISL